MSVADPAHGASSALDALSRMVVSDDANLEDALRRVAISGCELLANCAAASVTLIEGDRANTVGSTNDVALLLDDTQYSHHDGPCLTAAREHRHIRIEDMSAETRWPAFLDRAGEHGIRSSLSVPLTLARPGTYGGFNVYGAVVEGFSDEDEQLCRAFAAQASIVVANVQAYWSAMDLSRNLTKAMESRAVIEQAKGVLMSTHGIDADEAFDLLRQHSQTTNRKLREVAVDVLADARDDRR